MSAVLEHDPFEGDQFRRFTCSQGIVSGLVIVREDGKGKSTGAAIHEWSSANPGNGHSKRALIELRQLVGSYIEAIDIGVDDEDPSFTFWVAMAERGLVDRLEDDDRNEVPFIRKVHQHSSGLEFGM